MALDSCAITSCEEPLLGIFMWCDATWLLIQFSGGSPLINFFSEGYRKKLYFFVKITINCKKLLACCVIHTSDNFKSIYALCGIISHLTLYIYMSHGICGYKILFYWLTDRYKNIVSHQIKLINLFNLFNYSTFYL